MFSQRNNQSQQLNINTQLVEFEAQNKNQIIHKASQDIQQNNANQNQNVLTLEKRKGSKSILNKHHRQHSSSTENINLMIDAKQLGLQNNSIQNQMTQVFDSLKTNQFNIINNDNNNQLAKKKTQYSITDQLIQEKKKMETHNNSNVVNDSQVNQRPSFRQMHTLDSQNNSYSFYNLKNNQYQNYKYMRNPNSQSQGIIQAKKNQKLMQGDNNISFQKENENQDKLEITINNIREQNNRLVHDTNNESDLPVILEWKSKLLLSTVQQQEQKQNPFLKKDRVQKNLKRLDNQIQQLNVDCSQAKVKTQKWLPPLQKYKNQELFVGESKKVVGSQQDDEIFINVLHYNQAFTGRGSNLRSYFETHNRANANGPHNHIELKKILNKKYQSNIILQEYNRLLKLDQIEKSNQRKNSKFQNNPQTYQKEYQSHFLCFETFVKHCKIFQKYIRNEQKIIDRILYTLKTPEDLLDFDSINNFFKIVIFRTAPIEDKLTFIAKFFRYDSVNFTMEDFLEVIKMISANVEKQQQKQQIKQNLVQPSKIIDQYIIQLKSRGYDVKDEKPMRLSAIEKIFSSEALDIDEIFSYFYNEI